jgi:hypothetical protein
MKDQSAGRRAAVAASDSARREIGLWLMPCRSRRELGDAHA